MNHKSNNFKSGTQAKPSQLNIHVNDFQSEDYSKKQPGKRYNQQHQNKLYNCEGQDNKQMFEVIGKEQSMCFESEDSTRTSNSYVQKQKSRDSSREKLLAELEAYKRLAEENKSLAQDKARQEEYNRRQI